MNGLLLLLAATVAVAMAAPARLASPELDEFWTNFKIQHKKQYEESEETVRRVIWENNLKYIQTHNLEADSGMHTYWLGVNQYADWTSEEFVGFMNGYVMRNRSSSEERRPIFMKPSHVTDLPAKVDWRDDGYVTEIKNQGQCGSCWSFSATGSMEGQNFKKTKTLVSLSEQNLMDCSKKEGNKGCQGGLMDNAFQYVIKNNGIDTEASYPYTAKNGRKCKYSSDNLGATISSFTDITEGSESDLQSAVATIGPISVAIDASHSSFQLYKTGVYNERRCSSTRLDHGVLAVGYGTYEGKDYWLVKNSWGKSWGMDGYVMMSRNVRNQCGIATSASYPVV
ncbi:procathepsin L-like [Lineus longissimus]|uniref:procathepsin L-like n=1 Tax=Lineus longissimus TaxID=88925 RepID=UPI002B4CAB28